MSAARICIVLNLARELRGLGGLWVSRKYGAHLNSRDREMGPTVLERPRLHLSSQVSPGWAGLTDGSSVAREGGEAQEAFLQKIDFTRLFGGKVV